MKISFEHEGGQSGQRLFFLIHGMEHTAAHLAQLKEAVRETFPADRVVLVTYLSSRWSNTKPFDVAERCVEEIDSECKQRSGGAYTEIILIGHSLGALIARKACLMAHGICSDYRLGIEVAPAAKPWANNIKRIVLLAGMSRGWRLRPRNEFTPRFRWLARCIQLVVDRVLGLGRLVREVHRGTPFIVNLRLDWLALVNGDWKGQVRPDLVVQLAGRHDTMVHPADHFDLQAGRNFQYLSVKDTKHNEMVVFKDGDTAGERKCKFVYALTEDPQRFAGDVNPELEPRDQGVTQVILLLHGIRDYGKWQEDLRDQLSTGAKSRNLRIETSISNYDYLPLLPFLFGYGRKLHIERFMDRYAEMRSQYPKAVCSFAGHSNGTYPMASALRRYQAARFERVALMGCIVQRNFPWLNQFRQRVGEWRNYVASADFVVAVFPSLFEMIRLVPLFHSFPPNRDFGSAGHTSFTQIGDHSHNITYVKGGHGAALGKDCRESLVSFLLGDAAENRVMPPVVDAHNRLVNFLHKARVLIWVALLAACVALFCGAQFMNSWLGFQQPYLQVALILLYILVLFRI